MSLRRKQREGGREARRPWRPSAQNPELLMVTGGAELSLYLPVVLDLESNVYPLLKKFTSTDSVRMEAKDLLSNEMHQSVSTAPRGWWPRAAGLPAHQHCVVSLHTAGSQC